jgi:phosphohistidine phosphatase
MTARRVYLVRHGDAEPSRGVDAARRLTPSGRAEFERHARALVAELAIRRVVTSPLLRARETAELLAAVTGARLEEDGALASGASSGAALLARLAREPAGTALVGHNPELAEALGKAAGRDLGMRKGEIAALDVEGGRVSVAWHRAP